MKSSAKNQRGMGLVEVMVAIGIMGILTSGLIALFVNSNKSQKGIEQKNDAQMIRQEIQGILSSSTTAAQNCATRLGISGAAFNPGPPIVPPALNVTLGGVAYAQGNDYTAKSGLNFQTLSLMGLTVGAVDTKNGVPVTKYSGFIRYQMAKTAAGQAAGIGVNSYAFTDIPVLLFVRNAGNTVYDCASLDNGFSTAACEDELGGTENTLMIPKCSFNNFTISVPHRGTLSDSGAPAYRFKVEDSMAIYSTGAPVLSLFRTAASTTITAAGAASVSTIGLGAAANTVEITPSATAAGRLSLTPTLATFTGMNANIGGTLGVTGTSSFTGNSSFAGTATFTGALIGGSGTLQVNTPMSINGTVAVTGNITATGTITASSDERLKTDMEPLKNSLAKLLKLEPIRFQYRSALDGQHDLGFSAQALREVVPEVVRENDNGYLSVAYGNITALLAGSVKEFFKKWEDQNQAQEERMTKLETEIKKLREDVEACRK